MKIDIGAICPSEHDGEVLDPAAWWRRVCWITDRVALSGDLHDNWEVAEGQLHDWEAQGVTHILDVRGEADVSYEEFRIGAIAPGLVYRNLGTHDDGGSQDDHWFENGVVFVREALSNPDTKVLIHCHMGVNRGPSMGFAVLLAGGLRPVDAYQIIRANRPVAGVIYAPSAVDWFMRANDVCVDEWADHACELATVMDEDPVDVGWIVNRIWTASWAA